jgi:hypothetical protein
MNPYRGPVNASAEYKDVDRSDNDVPRAQFLVVGTSLFWAVLMFGVIDLDTALPPSNPEFRGYWFLEGSWGVLVTSLIMAPLLSAAFRPSMAGDVARQLIVLAAAFAVAAAVCLAGTLSLMPLGLSITALLPWWLGSMNSQSPPQPMWRRLRWPLTCVVGAFFVIPTLISGGDAWTVKTVGILAGLLGLVGWLALAPGASTGAVLRGRRPASWSLLTISAVAAGPALGYAASMAELYWDGVRYTSAFDRIAAQVALPLALVALPAAAGWGWLPLRLASWTSAVMGAGFGTFAVLDPDELASPGAVWGVVAILWSVSLAAVSEAATRAKRA